MIINKVEYDKATTAIHTRILRSFKQLEILNNRLSTEALSWAEHDALAARVFEIERRLEKLSTVFDEVLTRYLEGVRLEAEDAYGPLAA